MVVSLGNIFLSDEEIISFERYNAHDAPKLGEPT